MAYRRILLLFILKLYNSMKFIRVFDQKLSILNLLLASFLRSRGFKSTSKVTLVRHFIVVETCSATDRLDRLLSTENSSRPGFFDLIDNDVTQKRGRMSKCAAAVSCTF